MRRFVASAKAPSLAVLLGALVPGGGHVYAGNAARGLAWFLPVTLLTFAGWGLAGPLLLSSYRLEFAVAGRVIAIPTLIPEVANLGETMLAQAWLGRVGPDYPPPARAPLGYVLTAAAAILNVLAMSDAHRRCRLGAAAAAPSGRSPVVAGILAWLLPGAGHWYLGRRGKGALAGSALLATFALGVALARGTVLQRERDQYFWSGEILSGLPAMAGTLADAGARIQSDLPLWELGLLCTTLAGLLNVLLILDAYSTAERDLAPVPAPAPAS